MRGIDEAPHDIENPKDPLLKELHNLFRLSPWRCIYRVPERLRQGNEKAYTPQVVSIGPLHHGKEHLKAMEEHKKRYLKHFLSRTRERVSFSDYIQMIKEKERMLRGYYAESIEFGSDQFVRIVLVDAAFVIEFLLRFYSSDYRQDEDDYIFNTPQMFWDVRPDLQLLENQLPFFILRDLFNTLFPSSHRLPSLLEISYYCFEIKIDIKGKEEKFNQICSFGDVQHFVDLLRIQYLPLEAKPIVEFPTTAVPNVTELVHSGVKLEVGRSSNLCDIKFQSGILKIPKFEVDETTNMRLRNLLAFEQCNTGEDDYLANYVFLMKRLVKTPNDVQLLVEAGIIKNWLGDAKKISTLLDDLGTGIVFSDKYYAFLCETLNEYRKKNRATLATFLQRYAITPWFIISSVPAAILLVLTLVQTACSIKSVP